MFAMNFSIGRLNRCDVYVFLWAIYTLQGFLYPQGLINQFLQMVMIFWCATVSIKYFINYQRIPHLLKTTIMLVYMYMIYGLIYMVFSKPVVFDSGDSPASYYYLQQSLNSLLPIFLFYQYSKKKFLTETRLRAYLLFFIIIDFCAFQHSYQEKLISDLYGRTDFTNNVSYSFLALMPMLYFYKKKPLFQYLLASVLLMAIMMGMKRGAIVIGALCFFQFLYLNWKNASKTNEKMIICLLTVLIMIVAWWYISDVLANNDYFIKRLQATEEMDSSGRDDLVKIIWNKYWLNIDVVTLFLGNGANATIAFAGNYAHQDWLETLCNNGLLGICILLSFYVRFFMSAMSNKHNINNIMSSAFKMLFIICIMKTLFSMSIQGMDLPVTLMLGFLSFYRNENTVIN